VTSSLNSIVWNGQGAPFPTITISVNGINDAGILVGQGHDQSGMGPVPYLYSNNAISLIPTGAYNYPGNYGVASSINNSNQVAGYAYGLDNYAHAAIFQLGGSTTFINEFDWANLPIFINNSGQVAGTNEKFPPDFQQPSYRQAYLYGGQYAGSLGTLGGTYSVATGLNDAGQVIGFSATASGVDHPFLYTNGSMIDLGTLGVSGTLNDINNAGVIVGSGSGGAFIYSGGTMQSLASVTDLSGSNFVSLVNATSINNAGQIVGYGLTSSGEYHAFLLTSESLSPVPEPSTYGTIGALGLVGLALRRRWKRRQTAPSVTQP
jgi:probable HAF family extracellular repeat protein